MCMRRAFNAWVHRAYVRLLFRSMGFAHGCAIGCGASPRTMLHDQLVLRVTSVPPGRSGPSSLSVDVGIPSNGASFRQAAGAHS